ncbi:protein-L-isoaspartate O-methyltransferase [Rhodobacteraceae bacterium NNCM2]|nr:protein-L-isoaspartate O-methyltransferase [Coraliihabitans acroporae]
MTDFDAARRAMVDCQVRPSDVTRYALIDAMLRIPREQFVPRSKREIAYAETEVEIAPGRALLAPRTFAKMVEAAGIRSTDLVLELCPATGYSTAILASMAEMVVSIEGDEGLSAQAQGLLEGLGVNNAVVTSGDPTAGDAAHGPYDLIFVNGSVEQIPSVLTDQLKAGGRLVAIVNDGATSACYVYTRSGSVVSRRFEFDGYGPMLAGFGKEEEFSL